MLSDNKHGQGESSGGKLLILLCSIFVKWNGILAKGSGVQLKIHVFEAVSV